MTTIPDQAKEIVVTTNTPLRFEVTRIDNSQVVLSGESGQPALWPLAGESAAIIDVGALTQTGNYRLTLADSNHSTSFEIRDDAYGDIHDAAIKAYYFNRAGMALDPAFAGQWQRPAGHPDTQAAVLDNPSDVRPSPKGWYDAGDYNKYIVNSNITVYSMLLAWEACKEQGIEYPSDQPALSYVDHTCNFASNEEAINWNAPLVYVLTALQ